MGEGPATGPPPPEPAVIKAWHLIVCCLLACLGGWFANEFHRWEDKKIAEDTMEAVALRDSLLTIRSGQLRSMAEGLHQKEALMETLVVRQAELRSAELEIQYAEQMNAFLQGVEREIFRLDSLQVETLKEAMEGKVAQLEFQAKKLELEQEYKIKTAELERDYANRMSVGHARDARGDEGGDP